MHGDSGAGTDILCFNCGTRLIGEHCHRCGQSGDVHRTLGAIGHDLAHGVFHLEGRIWRTLPMLAFRPGELTRRYVAGERARFVSPVAVFLFSVFLLFAVVAQLPGWHFGDGDWLSEHGVEKARTALVAERRQATDAIRELQDDIADAEREHGSAGTIAGMRQKLAKLQNERADLIRTERLLPRQDEGSATKPSGWLEAKWRHATENPQLLIYKLKSSAYKYSWALIPISLPLIWLLFPLRRDVGLYDHAVFATYSLSFMSLLVIVLAVLGAIGVAPGLLWVAALIVPPLHLYKQLKGAYRLSRAGALWRTWWMVVFASVATILFVTLLLYLGTAD